MIKNYKKLIIFKNWQFFLGLIISIGSHLLLFIVLDFKKDNLLGTKFIPIELIATDTSFNIGDTFDESKSGNIKNNLEFKEDTLINDIKKENIEKIEKKPLEKKIINNNLTNNIDLENQNRGIKKGKNDQNFEKGSILGKGLQKITCLNCVKPKYPKLAMQRGYEGVLKLLVTIEKNGSVKNILVTKSTGYEILDKAGIKAARESKFYPISKESELNIIYDLKLN